jgi:nitrite reductase/ring-hydroxylating ferredoxin subunit
MTSTPTERQSRLDPDPIARRDFLGLSAIAAAAGALFFALVGMVQLPKAAVLPVPSRKFRVTLPETLAPGAAFQPPGRNIAVVRRADGVYAVSLICTHLGCIVKPSPTGFDCPCHGSRFTLEGAVTHGPAPTALQWVQIEGADGEYTIDESIEVPRNVGANV